MTVTQPLPPESGRAAERMGGGGHFVERKLGRLCLHRVFPYHSTGVFAICAPSSAREAMPSFR